MLEKIKEVPFIDESTAVRLITKDGKLILERTDRVIWASESTQLAVEGIDCYVEAAKFFSLFPDIKSLSQSSCLDIVLKNGAEYHLPFISVSWETQEMPTEYSNTITFNISDLMLCTLRNLIKPELQCIWIDKEGAVSCDFVSACISSTVKANEGFLLPPDVQELVNGRQCKVQIQDGKMYFQTSDFSIIASKPAEGEDKWYEQLRAMLDAETTYVKGEPLAEALKRLMLFSDYASFDGKVVTAGENFEPFEFEDIPDTKYEIERLAKILTTATEISNNAGNLILKNKVSKFLISPMEEA